MAVGSSGVVQPWHPHFQHGTGRRSSGLTWASQGGGHGLVVVLLEKDPWEFSCPMAVVWDPGTP